MPRLHVGPLVARDEAAAGALAAAYAERPMAVITAIAATDAKLQTLADAFRLKPPKS